MHIEQLVSWKSFFSVHSFNEHYLSIPQYRGCWGNLFKDAHGTSAGFVEVVEEGLELADEEVGGEGRAQVPRRTRRGLILELEN